MKKIRIDEVTVGTRLARPVMNESGIILFGEGTVLNEKTLERIKALGIDYIYIEGASSPRRPLEEELKELESRFSMVTDIPYMTTIKIAVKEYIASLYEDECKTDKG